MKTIIILSIAIFTFTYNLSFASMHGAGMTNSPVENNLAPSVPKEADFGDPSPEPVFRLVSICLITPPSAPKEATFEEFVFPDEISTEYLLRVLGPVTPKEAEFEEDSTGNPELGTLAPGTPREAEFEGTI